MATIFMRHYPPSFWDPRALSGPCPHLTLREWEVGVILCSLPLAIRKALVGWLLAPTDRQRRAPFAAGEPREPAETLRERFRADFSAICRTLDMPLEALHGISRDTLLVAHGARLRQLAEALGERLALQEIVMMRESAEQKPPRPAAYLSQRWGGRWAWLFGGKGRQRASTKPQQR
jgi:hypothetical protein